MENANLYTPGFYQNQMTGSARSAHEMVPLIIQETNPDSVVDIGCGVGTWAASFRHFGIKTVIGVDGDYVPHEHLQIPLHYFRPMDLASVGRSDAFGSFSLATCFEVAEHLPSENNENFVDFLCELAPIVVFGAAVPGQGGTNHINEQPQSYWATLFRSRGYAPSDVLRRTFWNRDKVDPWYTQNTIIYRKGGTEQLDLLLDIVHPRVLQGRAQKEHSLRKALRAALAEKK